MYVNSYVPPTIGGGVRFHLPTHNASVFTPLKSGREKQTAEERSLASRQASSLS